MLYSDYNDREQVKALLSELKILIHIGQHLNILNLVGAVTKEMHRGMLFRFIIYPYSLCLTGMRPIVYVIKIAFYL